MAMMFAFWLGTLPWLGLVSQGSQWLQRIHPQAFQWMAALMLIGFGFWTWASRSEVDLRGLERVNMTRGTGTTVEDVEAIRETPLPCCSKESE
jgi:sulfite exporter TauE/SafE